MGDLSVLLAAIQGSEARLRDDLRGLGARVGVAEVEQGKHQIRLDKAEAMLVIHHKRLRFVGIPEVSGIKFGTVLEFLTELPKLWHVLVAAAALIMTIAALTHRFLP